jgi:biopolymer transport protein ExbD
MLDLDDNDGATEINLTPMIDCVFLLLIFFLVASTLAEPTRRITLELPSASGAASERLESPPVVIALDASGATFLDGQPLALAELLDRVDAMLKEQPERVVRLDADRAVAYQRVIDVIDGLRARGVRGVSLQSRPQ